MSISNAELLDIIRRLRSYVATLDNIHSVLNIAKESDDVQVAMAAKDLIDHTPPVATKVSMLLRKIESSKAYREVVRSFNLKEEDI